MRRLVMNRFTRERGDRKFIIVRESGDGARKFSAISFRDMREANAIVRRDDVIYYAKTKILPRTRSPPIVITSRDCRKPMRRPVISDTN